MKRNFIYALAAFAIIIQSCAVKSLHPIYESEQTICLPELEGDWLMEGEDDGFDPDMRMEYLGDTSSISGQISHGYLFSFLDNPGDTIRKEVSVHLVEIEGVLFCDLYASKNWSKALYSVLDDNVLPVHIFGKVEMDNNSLRFYSFNGRWLEKLFEQNKVRISHEKIQGPNDMITVLTASTSELQKFIAKYHDVEDAFDKPMIFIRKQVK